MKIITNGPIQNITKITGISKRLVSVEILEGPAGSSVSQPDDEYDNAFIWSDDSLSTSAICYHLDAHCSEVWCDRDRGSLDHDPIYIGFQYGESYYTAILSNGSIHDVEYRADCQTDKLVPIDLFDSSFNNFVDGLDRLRPVAVEIA